MADQHYSIRDTIPVKSLPENRRSSYRYLCHIKALYNNDEEHQGAAPCDDTWSMARVIDISTKGIALVLHRHFVPGTTLSLVPLIPSWNPQWVLTMRVTNLRPGPGHTWCAGCEFAQPLTGDQLHVFLQNSK